MLCCESGIPGIWNWQRATISATLSLSIVALCLYSLHGYHYLFLSSFSDTCLKLGICLCHSDSKTCKKSMSHGSDEVSLLSIHQKPPHLSLITPASSLISLFIWLTDQRLKQCLCQLAGWCADRPPAAFRKGKGTLLFPCHVSSGTILFHHKLAEMSSFKNCRLPSSFRSY